MEVMYTGNSIWSVYLNFVKATSSHWSALQDLKNGSWTSSIDSGSTLYCDPPSTSSWVTANVELKAAF